MPQAEEILNKLMLEISKEQNYIDYDLKIEPVSSGGANYTSTLYNVTITEGDHVVHLFAKVAALGEKVRTHAKKFYEIENFAYTKLLKVYEQLEDEHEVPQEHRLVFSKFYGCNTTLYEETIVLEDLVINGYQAYDRFKSIDWEYARAAFRELAKMHALAFAYNKAHPEEFNKLARDLKFEWSEDTKMMSAYFEKIVKRSINLIEVENKDKLKNFFEIYPHEMFPEYFAWRKQPVLGHGDYRPSNLMHKIQEVS